MAHFAQLDENNVVLRVVVVGNADTSDADGVEDEEIGIAFCQGLFGGTWRQASRSGSIRANYPGPGFAYDPVNDVFVPPQPYPSWTINPDTWLWEAPTPMPDDGTYYAWDETTLSWKTR